MRKLLVESLVLRANLKDFQSGLRHDWPWRPAHVIGAGLNNVRSLEIPH